VGTVSGLAAAFPEVVAELVHDRSDAAHRAVVRMREVLGPVPFQSALKAIVAERGVPVRVDVRAPLRPVSPAERAVAVALLDEIVGSGRR